MTPERWTFEAWFRAQFGDRPSSDSKLDDKVEEAEFKYSMLAALKAHCDRWDMEYRAALYAWNLRDENKR